jgi:hypothetical protein
MNLYERPGTDNEEEDGQAHADSTFQSQIKAMFSSDAQIYINHTGPVSVEEFSTQIGQTFGTNKSTAEWKECFEIEDRDGQEGVGKVRRHSESSLRPTTILVRHRCGISDRHSYS